MKKITQKSRLLSLLLAVLLLFSCMPLLASAQEEFSSENLFLTQLASKEEILFYSTSSTATSYSRFNSRGAMDASVDGDTTTSVDAYAFGGHTNWIGALYTLNGSYFCDRITLYSGTSTLLDYYRVYASDSLDTLYSAENMVAEAIECNGSGQEIMLNKSVQYVAVICNDTVTTENGYDNCFRVKEFQLWSGDESSVFIPENLFGTQLASKEEIIFYSTSSTAASNSRFNSRGAMDASVDGDTTTSVDAYAFGGHTNWIGALYTLNGSYFCDRITLYSGTSTLLDYYRVYASDSLDTLYSAENMVAEAIECDGSGQEIVLNKSVQYVAVICNDTVTTENGYDNCFRVKEFQLWSGDESSVFIPENLFGTQLASKEEIIFYSTSSTAASYSRFNSRGAMDASVDGDLATSVDAYAFGGHANWIGALYTLNGSYFCDRITLYSGTSTLLDYYRVYASDSLDTLYSAKNMVAEAIECDGSGQEIVLNKYVQYVAVICNDTVTTENGYDNCFRVKEFELWSGDESSVFIPENLLQTDLQSAATTAMYVSNGSLLESTKFDQKGALAGSTDGELTTTHAVYDCISGWEHPIYPGAVYTLNENHYVGKLNLYANGTVKVYASDALDTLYSAYNCVADDLTISTDGTEITLNKYVKYLAVFCNGYVDVVEFQLWSADPTGAEIPEETSMKVLTIGNSFSENASIYASEIAAANGYELTFGYLKFPSCTLEQHLEAAQNDLAVFKFQITDPSGNRTTLKSEASSFTSPDPENCASISEALQYTDWDVVVFQQESFTSLDASSFAALSGLTEYVNSYLPNARLMLHEVWSWGSWQNDSDKNFAKIKANNQAAAIANGLEIIPSGLAFEYAREVIGDYTALNDIDSGYYQHANTYGQYAAGCCYVASVFGAQLNTEAFANHQYINADGYAAALTEAANRAVTYYNSYGDVNADGAINADDLTALRKYLLNNSTQVEETLSDATYDGQINILDLVRIKKHLCDESVKLGLSK